MACLDRHRRRALPGLLLLVTVVNDLVPDWPTFVRLLVVASLAVAWIVWGFAPIQRRVLQRWH